ncbi:MAG: bacterial Ig-like domain-containing protein [Bacteroidales bacterium]|nr:bacterial Ig-like domain-containing protein [Bacteroidales bacterium]
MTVKFLELTAELNVKVAAKSVASIAIKTMPTKVEYIEGEDFVADGGEIEVVYNNNTTATVALSEAALSGYSSNYAGEKTITAKCLNKTVRFTVFLARTAAHRTAAHSPARPRLR